MERAVCESLFKTPVPGHQRLIIVSAEVVPVFQDILPHNGLRNACRGRQDPIGENILADPRISTGLLDAAADSMQQKQSVIIQQATRRLDIGPIVLSPHMLEHADGNDPG